MTGVKLTGRAVFTEASLVHRHRDGVLQHAQPVCPLPSIVHNVMCVGLVPVPRSASSYLCCNQPFHEQLVWAPDPPNITDAAALPNLPTAAETLLHISRHHAGRLQGRLLAHCLMHVQLVVQCCRYQQQGADRFSSSPHLGPNDIFDMMRRPTKTPVERCFRPCSGRYYTEMRPTLHHGLTDVGCLHHHGPK